MTWLRLTHVACCFAYLGVGWYLQWRAPQRMVAAALAAIAATWGVWSGTLIVIHDPDATPLQVARGYDLGVLGWAGIGSLALAAALGFTGRSRLLARRGVQALLVLPPLVVIGAQWTGVLADHYARYPWGWGFVWSTSAVVYGFYAYYGTCVAAALYLVVAHGHRTRERQIRRYSWLIALTGGLALLGGTVTDVALPRLGIHAIPNLAPAFLAVFFIGLTVAVVRYRALELTPENAGAEILAAMRDGVLLVNRDGTVIDANRAAHELFAERQVVGATLRDLLPDGGTPAIAGRELAIERSEVADPRGVPLGSVCLIRDITEQARATQALREIGEQLDVQVAGRTRELDLANQALARALAIRGALSNIVESIHRADSPREIADGVARSLVQTLERPVPCRVLLDDLVQVSEGFTELPEPVTFELLASGTRRGQIELHGAEARGEDHRVVTRIAAEVGLALEVLALRNAIAQADRLASVGVLAAGVAHEINNPLTYLSLGLTQIDKQLAQPSFDIERIRNRIAQALDASQRIAKVVRELGAFARDANETRPVALKDAVGAAIEIARHQVEHRATLIVDVETPVIVQGDAGRITQVFVNLLVNAAHAMPEGHSEASTITISSKDEPGQTIIAVSDTGTGIPPEALHRIFDPFFTTKSVGDGSGLGLAISFKIVRSFGGTIVASNNPDGGARFEVRIPHGTDLLARTLTPRPLTNIHSRRILIIDDDVQVARALGDLLDQHDVAYTSSGLGARSRLLQGDVFDLVICDLMMPDLSGAELYAWAGTHRPDLAPRFLFVTGGAFTPDANAFAQTHRDRLLTKPFDADALERAIDKMTARS